MWLSLGCGSGGQEIFAGQQGLYQEMDAMDLSSHAIEVARTNATKLGVTNINFKVGDFKSLDFVPDQYDVILMSMSLHHVADLEGFFLKLQKLLKLNGMLIINEYIGPSQMQFTKKQISIVNRLLGILSDKYKYDYVLKQMKCRYVMKSRSEWD